MLKQSLLVSLAVASAFAGASSQESPWFRVKKSGDKWWFTSPRHSNFWSLGVDCTDLGDAGKPENPNYHGLKLFGNEDAWASDVKSKFKAWGINTLGGWSYIQPFKDSVPHAVVLHLGAYHRAPWNDLYAKDTYDILAKAAADQIPKLRNNKNLIGYFSDNELGWWDDTLFTTYFSFGRKAPGKQALVTSLKKLYKNRFKAFQAEWMTEAKSFDGLLDQTKIYLRPGTRGIRAVHAFNYDLTSHYYRLMRTLIRKHDPNHLILGDRYAQYYNIATVRASKPYVDVVSTNAGADWLDGTYTHSFFNNLHRMTGKPVMVTEFYFSAMENRTGNRNSGTAFPKVQTQAQRAKGFEGCLNSLARLPYMVGAHWFQFADEPPKGRGDGEDWNFGLVDIFGQEYTELTNILKDSRMDEFHRAGPFPAVPGTPPAPAKPLENHLTQWQRPRALLASNSYDQWADCYVSYDASNLYVGLVPMEYGDLSLYKDKNMPNGERPLLELSIGSWRGSVRYGFEKKASLSKGIAEVAERPGLKHILTLRIPAQSFGKKTLRAGDKLQFKAGLTSHGRGYQMSWSKNLTLAK